MELSKLKLEMEKGNLVPRNQSIEWLSLLVSTAKAKLLGLPRRTRDTFAALTDAKEIERIHLKESRETLQELAAPLKGKKEKGTS